MARKEKMTWQGKRRRMTFIWHRVTSLDNCTIKIKICIEARLVPFEGCKSKLDQLFNALMHATCD
jgi:hypothetical protein